MPTPAGPGTNRYRCESCGRYFNEEEEFHSHRTECQAHELRHHGAGRDHDPEHDREWVSTP
jgi:hypothetical protein